jgi:5-methylcytosine-specific restriction endonuclease McrA
MGTRGDKVKSLKKHFDMVVRTRDNNRCFLCPRYASDVHEIISKSQFSTNELQNCIIPKNMVCLCREHHDKVQGNKAASANLLRSLRDIYEYEYTEEPFKWYVEEE